MVLFVLLLKALVFISPLMFNCSGDISHLIPGNPFCWNLLMYMAQNSEFFLPPLYTIFCIVTRDMIYLIVMGF